MSTNTLHKVILSVGFLSLFHAAYSAAQRAADVYNTKWFAFKAMQFLLNRDEPRRGLNTETIFLQALISLFVIMYGVLHVAGEFKEIKASADLDNKSWETFRNIPSFYTFCHRGRSFSG